MSAVRASEIGRPPCRAIGGPSCVAERDRDRLDGELCEAPLHVRKQRERPTFEFRRRADTAQREAVPTLTEPAVFVAHLEIPDERLAFVRALGAVTRLAPTRPRRW